MPLTLRSSFLKSSGNEGLLLMVAEGRQQAVLVTRQALEDVCSPPRSDEFRLQEHIGTFCAIARAKYEAGEIQPDGRVWITGTDVRKWQESTVH